MQLGAIYIDTENLIHISSVITALGIIIGVLFAAFKWYSKQKNIEVKVDQQQEEMCMLTYGVLACLKGLQEQGCNGPVSEAINKIEKYINKKAHDQE